MKEARSSGCGDWASLSEREEEAMGNTEFKPRHVAPLGYFSRTCRQEASLEVHSFSRFCGGKEMKARVRSG